MSTNPPTFTILVVCSGNICRSPLAEQLLRARLASAPEPFRLLSAGTIAEEGAAMTDEAAALSAQYGGDPQGHRSRPLSATQIQSADLVLTATRAHRAAVVSLVPRASRITFTLKEFAALVESLSPEERAALPDAAAVVEAAAAQRGLAQHQDDDIEDPYRRPLDVYERVARAVDDATGVAAQALTRWAA
jgi:protein-tyrosine phosphatase